MEKGVQTVKKKISATYRIDEELYCDAMKKCYMQSLEKGKRVTLSKSIQELILKWVKRKI